MRRHGSAVALAIALVVAIAACGSDASTTSASGPHYANATAVAEKAGCDYESATPPSIRGRRPTSFGRCGYGTESVAILVFAANGASDRAFADASSVAVCRRLRPSATRRLWFARGPNWFATSADGFHGVRAVARATGARVVDRAC